MVEGGIANPRFLSVLCQSDKLQEEHAQETIQNSGKTQEENIEDVNNISVDKIWYGDRFLCSKSEASLEGAQAKGLRLNVKAANK